MPDLRRRFKEEVLMPCVIERPKYSDARLPPCQAALCCIAPEMGPGCRMADRRESVEDVSLMKGRKLVSGREAIVSLLSRM